MALKLCIECRFLWAAVCRSGKNAPGGGACMGRLEGPSCLPLLLASAIACLARFEAVSCSQTSAFQQPSFQSLALLG